MTGVSQVQLTVAWLQAEFPTRSNLAPLGSGGQRHVFSATHPTDGDVVLKLFQPASSDEDVRREILAAQAVAAANVPKILEHGKLATPLGPCHWLREQRVHGSTLRERLKLGPLAATEVLRLGKQLLQALHAAELVDIVHRDVKPDNIIVDANGNFWLLDFGLARHLSLVSQTATAAPFGKLTWGYAPREQCRNDKDRIDSRADLYALGITMFEAATATNPMRDGARDVLEILKRVETMRLTPLSFAISDAESFRDLLAAMTQPRRDHRPRTTAEALAWIEEICAHNGII
jgi:serine/threonine protein kinase